MHQPAIKPQPARLKISQTLCRTAVATAISLSLFSEAQAANIMVGGGCDLIEAIVAANSDTAFSGCTTGSGPDTIILADGSTHTLSSVFVEAVPNITTGQNGLPVVTSTITMQSPGNGAVIGRPAIAPTFRIMQVGIGGTLTLDNVSLQGGYASTYLGATQLIAQDGGGVHVVGSLIMQNGASIAFNRAQRYGGGMALLSGSVEMQSSTVSYNTAASQGGGFFNHNSGTITLNNSTISGNTSNSKGGGIYNLNSLTLNNSTLSGNYAPIGGGLFHDGVTASTLNNCTVSGNNAPNKGGGIYSKKAISLTNCTVADNTASLYAGLYSENAPLMTMHNNLIANNQGGDCRVSNFGTSGNNLVSDNTCAGFAASQAPSRLGPLDDNGGPTQTHALLAGSAAIDAGNDTLCNAMPISGLDQRGESRPDGAQCDIGAYEGFIDDGGFFVIPAAGKGTVIFSL